MTAEVGVLNKSAIALAADSAVTIRSSSNTKIFNSVNKLFEMSNNEPVGIMIYGSAELAGIPWETVIKDYRSHLGKTAFNRIDEYRASFIEFIEGECDCFDQDVLTAEAERFFVSHFLVIYRRFWEELDGLLDAGKKLGPKDAKKIFAKRLLEVIGQVRSLEDNKLLSDAQAQEFLTRFRPQIIEAQKAVFSKVSLSKGELALVEEFASLVVKKAAYLQDYSGVVFAGFGRKENFPHLTEVGIEALLGNTLKYRSLREVKIDPIKNASTVIAFAQSDVVNSFMEGIDPEYRQFQSMVMRNLVDEISSAAYKSRKFGSKKTREEYMANLKKNARKALKVIEEDLKKFRHQYHWGPIVSTVDALPKDELAAMAEALVNLTSLRRRVSSDLETVGGPVDVAVISKGDGFIWIKRKHYFDIKMNPRYSNRISR